MTQAFHVKCANLAKSLNELGHPVSAKLLKPSARSLAFEDEPTFKRTPFYSLALEYYLDDGELWASKLNGSTKEPEWYLVDVAAVTDLEGYDEDRYFAAKSKMEALAFVIDQLDYRGVVPTHIHCDGENVRIYQNENLLSEIQPIQFSRVVPEFEQRITHRFEKLFWSNSTEDIQYKFRKIPGLEKLVCNLSENPIRGCNHPLLHTTKSLANQMEAFLPKVTTSALST
ncbi:hypothetical protein [Rheinheimera soli]|uniref:Uncharacterized protein n=1 Tax=Rheinheimera soli TaxID=443616 RepID=A0ABU1W2T7_9GAMM|nr:hypothetical protein [Rheinheimera soli]MDR7122242.1 hypothetical protein [Rheinheimera soli]